jgi:hypothetical protein
MARTSTPTFHQLIQCDECHPARKYKLEKMQCNECHAKDDVHEKKLGEDCAKCHETTGGAPKFDHNVHTDFRQEGVHARIECEGCHFLVQAEGGGKPIGGEPAKQPVLPGADAAKEKAAIAKPGAPLDLLFRAAGSECDACHPDPHQVRDNLACDSCHSFEKWQAPPRNAYHELAGFSLTGAHTIVACSMCHTGAGSMRGRGQRCGTCHAQDDIHAGSFGSECGSCHMQDGWVPTTFTHVDTGYVLEGIHRTLECRQCHLAGNYFIGKNPRCFNCHLDDYFNSNWHEGADRQQNANNAARGRDFFITGLAAPIAILQGKSFDCENCHTQFTFAGALNDVPP